MSEAVRVAPAEREAPPEPVERGKLEIDRSVLRKITEHAADSVPGCVRTRRRVAGLGFGEHGARAKLSGHDQELRVRLDVALRYPSSVPETARAVRTQVINELTRIAGCRVHTVDITVSALVPASPPRVE